MQTLPIGRYRFFQRLQPLLILNKVVNANTTGCLQVFSTSVSWLIYLEKGKLVYACYESGMFEILYKKLQILSKNVPALNNEVYIRLKAIFETGIENQAIPNPDYLAICWLVNQKYLSQAQAATLIEEIAMEVLQSFLLLQEGCYELASNSFIEKMPRYCRLDVLSLIEQTPSQNKHNSKNTTKNTTYQYTNKSKKSKPPQKLQYTIMCIDDSPSISNMIKNFLDESFFNVVEVNDSLKALMQTIRVKPDLILLDIAMPNLNGYEFCSLLRKHSYFKNTPVIMVTARTSLVDKAKSKIVGASGYLTKPFTQVQLMKIIFQNIQV
ncbi:response regulator receiver protein PatA [Calothrix sp. NIES-4071]|nr:response regulator receiver protein PatA [Calothrix sp. NIES-4071]BAZ57195.1 response regulator receiver protein PatA [Calothrix sp. NIES-4105]